MGLGGPCALWQSLLLPGRELSCRRERCLPKGLFLSPRQRSVSSRLWPCSLSP